jgi:hypothetical protein
MNAFRLTTALLALIAIASAVVALQLGLWRAGAPGPGLFPFMASVMLFVTSIAAARERVDTADRPTIDRKRLLRHSIAISAFAAGFAVLGAWFATFAFMTGVLRGIERVGWLKALGVGAAFAAFAWLVFRQFLGVPLPTGLLGTR